MIGRFSLQEFLSALDSNLGMKFALVGLTIPGWIAPLAVVVVAGVPERIVVPILLLGLLPFQYACFCILQIVRRPVVHHSQLLATGDIHAEVASFASAIAMQVNALSLEAERQRVTLSQQMTAAALMSMWFRGLGPEDAIRQQQVSAERVRSPLQMDQFCVDPHRRRRVPSSTTQTQAWVPPRPSIAAGVRS